MTYAFKSINSSGYTQIDETSESFLVVQTGTKPSGSYYVQLSSALPDDVLVFARPSGGRTSGTFSLAGYVSDFTTNGTRTLRAYMGGPVACDYAVVKRSSQFTASSSGFGLEIYNASNQLAYSSNQPMFRAVAARSVDLTTSSGAFSSAWYQGSTGSIDSAYVLLGPYSTWQYEQYSSGNEKFYRYRERRAFFDYDNHTMGTKQLNISGDLSSSASTYVRTNQGQRTEIMGYIA